MDDSEGSAGTNPPVEGEVGSINWLTTQYQEMHCHVCGNAQLVGIDIQRFVRETRRRADEMERLAEKLLAEAKFHAMEARAQRATVHECYQAASGATGEKGDWNGARPILEALGVLEMQANSLIDQILASRFEVVHNGLRLSVVSVGHIERFRPKPKEPPF